jgi:hypothetical protein
LSFDSGAAVMEEGALAINALSFWEKSRKVPLLTLNLQKSKKNLQKYSLFEKNPEKYSFDSKFAKVQET